MKIKHEQIVKVTRLQKENKAATFKTRKMICCYKSKSTFESQESRIKAFFGSDGSEQQKASEKSAYIQSIWITVQDFII